MPKIEIYTSFFCGYCTRAKALLAKKGVSFEEIDVGANPKMRQEMIQRSKGHSTVPQIFVGETHVGGCDELYAMERAGKLDSLIAG